MTDDGLQATAEMAEESDHPKDGGRNPTTAASQREGDAVVTPALDAAERRLDELQRNGDICYTSNHYAAREIVRAYLDALDHGVVAEAVGLGGGQAMPATRRFIKAVRP